MERDETKSLLENLDEFVAFARSRISDPDLAADVVQESLLKAIRSEAQLKEHENVRAWFYRILRNTIIDLYRRRDVELRALESYQPDTASSADDAMICRCMNRLIPSLKPEYASVLQAVDLQEKPIRDVAQELGISESNLNVRLHRARARLRERLEQTCKVCAHHGCLDCTCG